MKKTWHRCDICGQFISTRDFIEKKVTVVFVQPDNHFGPEQYEMFHKRCKEK